MRALCWIVEWSLRNRAVVLFATLVFIFFGLRAARSLPMDAVPDPTTVQVQIITRAPALSPLEIEQYVTVPVERAMSGTPRMTESRSISKYGLSVVTVVFEEDTDIYFARQLVNERLSVARESVPTQYGSPEMGPISTGLGEVFQFVVQNDAMTIMQREELLDWVIAPQLRAVKGVVEVNSLGGEDRQYQVVVDPKRLQAADVSIEEVVRAIQTSNANVGGGYIEHDREEFVIGTSGLIKDLDDLRRVVIGATPQGVPVTVASVADVRFGPRLRLGAATKDGRGETVGATVLMLMGENAREVTAAVKDKLAAMQSSLPAGTRIESYYDRSRLVQRTIRTVTRNLLEGAALVILVLLLFLGDLRAGLVVAVTIPLSLLFAVVVMRVAGLSGNLMSLGAIDFGLIVDGAVIIVENAVRRLAERRGELGRDLSIDERAEVVRGATIEVRAASVFGEAIIAIVYVPVLTLSGIEGKLFRPMATTVLLALAGAFVLSLTLIPVLTTLFVRPRAHDRETWLVRKAHALFAPVLDRVMRVRWLVVAGAAATLTGAVVLFGRLGAEFVPQLDEGDMLVEARRLTGVALSESLRESTQLETALLRIPEVVAVVSRTGAPEVATDPMGVEQTDVYLTLRDREEWRPNLTREALATELARATEESVPEITGGVSQPIQMRTNELIAGIRSDVAVLVYGNDLDVLRRLGDEIANRVRTVPGVVDLRVEQIAGLPYLRVVPDRAKLARYGLSIDDVNQVAQAMAVGVPTGTVLEGERRFGIVVRTDLGFDGDLSPFLGLPLKSVNGAVVPLGDVATLSFQEGPAEIARHQQSRRLSVEFNVRERDVLGTVRDAQRALVGLDVPTAYRIDWGGQFEHYAEAKERLLFVVPLAFMLILFLLWLAFRSLRAAALIFLNVPFAIVGGVAALSLRRLPFSISAGVGFVALFGVAVLNGLVLVSFARRLESEGVKHIDAIARATHQRLRPVLTTALVASLGFVPMALSRAPGSEVQRPLATVVIGGLVTATLLTLVVFPVVYAWLGRERGEPPVTPKDPSHGA